MKRVITGIAIFVFLNTLSFFSHAEFKGSQGASIKDGFGAPILSGEQFSTIPIEDSNQTLQQDFPDADHKNRMEQAFRGKLGKGVLAFWKSYRYTSEDVPGKIAGALEDFQDGNRKNQPLEAAGQIVFGTGSNVFYGAKGIFKAFNRGIEDHLLNLIGSGRCVVDQKKWNEKGVCVLQWSNQTFVILIDTVGGIGGQVIVTAYNLGSNLFGAIEDWSYDTGGYLRRRGHRGIGEPFFIVGDLMVATDNTYKFVAYAVIQGRWNALINGISYALQEMGEAGASLLRGNGAEAGSHFLNAIKGVFLTPVDMIREWNHPTYREIPKRR